MSKFRLSLTLSKFIVARIWVRQKINTSNLAKVLEVNFKVKEVVEIGKKIHYSEGTMVQR